MTLSKVTSNGITDSAVTTAKIANCGVATADLAGDAVTSAKITDGTVAAGDLASSLDLSGKTVTLPQSAFSTVDQNIALLGFKMAVNEGLTVFNLVDGVVDEFHDESGTDEGEGSNDLYCASNDYYVNSTSPTGAASSFSGGYTKTAITEPDTGTAGTGSCHGSGQSGQYTVQTGVTSVSLFAYGAGGGRPSGGGGGFSTGALAVTAGQTLHVVAGEHGVGCLPHGPGTPANNDEGGYGGGGGVGYPGTNGFGSGGGFSGVFSVEAQQPGSEPNGDMFESIEAPEVYLVAGGGGGAGNPIPSATGGSGGGLVGGVGASNFPVEASELSQSRNSSSGAGGGQTSGGQAGNSPSGTSTDGGFLTGGGQGNPVGAGGGGGGYYGGGGGVVGSVDGAGGGGSSFHGHPQITSGSTEHATLSGKSAGEEIGPSPLYPSILCGVGGDAAKDGFVFITGTSPATTTSTTIVSNAFTASSAPSSSRIVVFQENVASPTLNTDIIASISRDGGSNFTTATLSDSGYVTGSSGQRILTGTATVSGQPSGTSMRWKLALANNAVKIHGVSLQWK
jgi:hypothetical protein